jgi:subtilisin family serine protease
MARSLFHFFLAMAAVTTSVATEKKVQSELTALFQVDNSTRADIMVVMATPPFNILEWAHDQSWPSRPERIVGIREKLLERAAEAQRPAIDLLHSMHHAEMSSFRSFWVANTLNIKGASMTLVDSLSAMPEVKGIHLEPVFEIQPVAISAGHMKTPTVSAEQGTWGVEKTNTHATWAAFGSKGAGVRVASVDTGARVTHEALRENFAGHVDGYGWFDPAFGSAEPEDDISHGTHVAGTIAGQNGIGMAPEALWMSCRGCRTSSCQTSDLLQCAEWILCPTLPDGSNPDCSKAPKVVSNSWGGGTAVDTHYESTLAYLAAGIVPVFSQGNTGPFCNSANSPGDLDSVIAVGASDPDDALASFSSRGPAFSGMGIEYTGDQKPEIVAPGVSVLSSVADSDASYAEYSGTSMAAPHVSGAIVLMQSVANGTLTVEDVRSILFSAADTAGLRVTDQNCGGVDSEQFPNFEWGHGRLNTFEAVKRAQILFQSRE